MYKTRRPEADTQDPLCQSVRDLRSGVSKEACISIAKVRVLHILLNRYCSNTFLPDQQLSAIMREEFEPLAESFFPSLLRQCMINVKACSYTSLFSS